MYHLFEGDLRKSIVENSGMRRHRDMWAGSRFSMVAITKAFNMSLFNPPPLSIR
jgi:hypothetical protein